LQNIIVHRVQTKNKGLRLVNQTAISGVMCKDTGLHMTHIFYFIVSGPFPARTGESQEESEFGHLDRAVAR